MDEATVGSLKMMSLMAMATYNQPKG